MDSLIDANEELKRVDHMVYVSLKYTRTVDVIRNTVERIILAVDFIMDALFEHLTEKNKIADVPTAPVERAEKLKELFKEDKKIPGFMDFYMLLRKLSRTKKYGKREEYRRHVTMIATLNKGEIFELDMDLLKEYYINTREFMEYVNNTFFNKKRDEDF